MEAADPKRAVIHLAAALGGVLLTLTLFVATAVVLTLRYSRTPAPIESLPTAPVSASADPSAPYRLPSGAEGLWRDDHFASAAAAPTFVAPSFEPSTPTTSTTTPLPTGPFPTTEAPAVSAQVFPTDSDATPFYNAAAFGPPEDDEIPALPAATRPPAAQRPTAEALTTTKSADTGLDAWDEPSAEEASVDELPHPACPVAETVPTAEKGPVAVASPESRRVFPEPTPRNLRELAAADEEALLSYTASTKDLSRRLESEVQAGFELGKSGAVYAARAKFVEVLRKIALAKDAAAGSTHCASALAEGLRTLDEADDFIPKGDALEAELDVAAIANSHGVRLVSETGPVAPHEAIAQYSQHSAERLAEAVAGEPAGSMALYGLGKSYARLEAQGGDTTAGRKSLVMYRAAIDAHPENFLAANELGVRLAQGGRYEQASEILRAAAKQPGAIATVHANLAAIEERLGRDQAAAAAQQESDLLANRERLAGEVSRRHGVEWVDPQAFRQASPNEPLRAPTGPAMNGPLVNGPVMNGPAMNGPMNAESLAAMSMASGPMTPGPMTPRPMTTPPAMTRPPAQGVAPYAAAVPPAGPSGWRAMVERAKQATGWSKPAAAPLPRFQAPAPQPTAPPVVATQTRVYR